MSQIPSLPVDKPHQVNPVFPTWLCGFTLFLSVPALADDAKPLPASPQDLTALTLEQLLDVRVESAALHPQTLEDAPASVTVLTAEDIRKYGYRTLAEALASVRGFYSSYDRSYHSVGVRGFNLPGDYASRFLIMVNGHKMGDHIFDSMLWLGEDFPVEMNLIKQIEIVRGPSAALYGSNGIFATINVVTKSPQEAGPPALILDGGSFGEKKAQVTIAEPIGKGASLLFSGSVFNNSGQSPLYFPQFDTPATNGGQAVRMDSERGYHFFANLVWRNWSITAVLSDRNKIQPISWGSTIFNDRGTQLMESAGYVEAAYTRELARGALEWRTYFNADHLRGRFDYPLETSSGSAVEDNRTFSESDWIGTRLSYRFDVSHLGTLTVGAESEIDLRAYQGSKDVEPVPLVFVNIDKRDKTLAFFLQDEKRLSPHWSLDLGARYDLSAYRKNFVSPRVALIYQPSDPWSYKFLFGRSFRNPSAFQLFYDDGFSAVANPDLHPESANTIEIDVERKLGRRMNLVAAGYSYWLSDFIEGAFTDTGLIQYQNRGKVHATGVEIEINGRPFNWLETTASYAFQKSTDYDADRGLENSPDHLAKLRFAVPLGRRFDASSSMQYYSSRRTLAGAWVTPVYLADFTITSKNLLPYFDVRLGIRNAFNRNYSDPIALTPLVDVLPQPGRTIFLELIAHGAR
jgi:outer membrane receptor for ferrienterochelin and colicins